MQGQGKLSRMKDGLQLFCLHQSHGFSWFSWVSPGTPLTLGFFRNYFGTLREGVDILERTYFKTLMAYLKKHFRHTV